MDIKANPEVTYTLEAFLPASGNWVSIKSGLKEEVEIAELLDQLRIKPNDSRSPATAFRMMKVTRDVLQFMEVIK